MRQRVSTAAIRTTAILGTTIALITTSFGTAAFAAGSVRLIFVSPNGSDKDTGTSADHPLRTIQAALTKAMPGTTINLAAGTYREMVKTVRSGTSYAPITIQGPERGKNVAGRRKAVLTGNAIVFGINHSNIKLRGFTIAGNEYIPTSAYPTSTSVAAVEAFKDANQSSSYTTQLVYLAPAAGTRNVSGITIDDMLLTSSGGECVHVRNNATRNTITNSVIQWCGMHADWNNGIYRYHNGEGIYLGTSPKNFSEPMPGSDRTSYTTIRNNTILTYGSECVDVKEGAHDNTIEGNECRHNLEPQSSSGANIGLRGDHNTVRDNTIGDSVSWGILMASDSASYDKGGNSLQGNTFQRATAAHIKISQRVPGAICGNTFDPSALQVVGKLLPAAPTVSCTEIMGDDY